MTGAIDRERLRDLFEAACDLPPDEAAAWLDARCAGEPALRAEVERLLAHDHPAELGFDARSRDALREVAVPEPLPECIGPYRVLGRLGEGGMGSVFEAEQEHPHRRVAIKMLRPELASPRMRRRLEHEAEVLGRLRHPGIAQVIELGGTESGASPYLVMERIDGLPLDEHVRRHRPGLRALLDVFLQVCDAVEHAHQNGVIHRDLKPSNVLVDSAGRAKVLDFGICRVTDGFAPAGTETLTGQIVGTLGYMSPEQVSGASEGIDTRSDVYSLGVMLYEVLAGRLPLEVEGQPLTSVLRLICERVPPRLGRLAPDARGDLETIVAKALEKEPARRYAAASALADDLRRALRHEPVLARPATTLYQLRKFARRNKALVAGVLASLALLAIGLVRESRLARFAEREAELATRRGDRATIAAADALVEDDPVRALRSLEEVPEARRGWEWRRLAAELDGGLVLEGDAHVVAAGGRPLAAVVRDDAVLVVDAASGETRIRVPTGFAAPARPRLSADGARLAVVSEADELVRVFDVSRAERVGEIPFPHAADREFVLDPTGARIALFDSPRSASGEDPTRVLEVASGASLWELPGQEGRPRRLAFAPDGRRAVLTNFDCAIVDAATGEPRAERWIEWAQRASVSPDGRRIAIQKNPGRCLVVDGDTLANVSEFVAHPSTILAMAFDSEVTRLATSGASGVDDVSGRGQTTRVWDLASGEPLRTLPFGGCESLAFDGAARVLYGAGRAGLRAWELAEGRSLVLRGHTSYVYFAVFSPDGRRIASGGWDRRLCLWDAFTGEQVGAFKWEGSERVSGLAFSADGRSLALTTRDEGAYTLRVLDLAAGTFATRDDVDDYWRIARGGAQRVGLRRPAGQSEASSADGKLRVRAVEDELVLEELATGRELARFPTQRQTASASFSADGRLLACGDWDGGVELWSVPERRRLGRLEGHSSPVWCLAFSPDGARLASGAGDNLIILWDVATLEAVADLPGHTGYVHALQFSPDGTQLVSGSGDGTLRLWDTVPRRERRRQARATAGR